MWQRVGKRWALHHTGLPALCSPEPIAKLAGLQASMYAILKAIHISTVLLTFVSFFVRGIWMFRDSSILQQAWVKIVPHVIDAVLLASAIVLMIQTHQYPGTHDWLTAKTLGIVFYIVFGSVALRRGRTRGIRITAWLGALMVFFYVVAVAVTRDPLPFFAPVV